MLTRETLLLTVKKEFMPTGIIPSKLRRGRRGFRINLDESCSVVVTTKLRFLLQMSKSRLQRNCNQRELTKKREKKKREGEKMKHTTSLTNNLNE